MQQAELKDKIDNLDRITWERHGGSFGLLEELRNWGTHPAEALLEAAVNHFDGIEDSSSHWDLCDMALERLKKLNKTIERIIDEAAAKNRSKRDGLSASECAAEMAKAE